MTSFLPAGVITEHPELAMRSTRGRGYPWRPFDDKPEDFFRGASSIAKVVDKPWLGPWRAKLAAEVAGDMRTELAAVTKANAVKLVKAAAREAADLAPARGSTIHDYAANQLAAAAGLQFRPVDVGPELDAGAANVTDWIDRHVETVHAIERTLYLPDLRVAGTVDAIVTTKSGGSYAVDWKYKHGKGTHQVSPDIAHAMQGWALGQSRFIAIPEQQQLHPLPKLDGFLVVYVAEDGHVTHPVDLTSRTLADLVVAACQTLDLLDAVGTSVFGPPSRHLTDSTSAPALVAPPVTA